ncbi:NADH dehydrogenase subunit 3 (mitochondrion) [Alligator mississippiensis]|uniref:NADH-ubiquinone oxidoreductase chain 3 n=3 Tax=Alligator mississippiensis TaxID=8496 RepID=NU3M_ALLMI|nr:NADH dehydrogenase subunit 3 [Alligator mississippiensis]O47874.2 RecName: Full=NADH-ubiquinone oxidoreductase chain 3; AltName: Full=NADH dehydrogenase subunit 3 [Alligator mississippiensis]AAD09987.1 NADH dehydrogenase subunit III [Alligator mississippiensis]AER37479.1 NADH dehydrogenase subunit 3 [Alligator mississippiensis]CAA73568.1 NADH dehydrogenase subunit 3 [Alligator mississippiensis]
MNLFIMLTMSSITVSIVVALNLLTAKTSPDPEKLSPYECGFDPLGSARLPLSIRFFMVGILFLLFDLEIAILLPLTWAIHTLNPLKTITWAIIIFLFLFIGLAYEWLQGGLEWAE